MRIQEEITEWERITDVGKNYRVVRNSKLEETPESGEMHEWEEITEPAKVKGWERIPGPGKLRSFRYLHLPAASPAANTVSEGCCASGTCIAAAVCGQSAG